MSQTKQPTDIFQHRIKKGCLLAAGLVSTALAILGIFLPLLPTVPLLLLAAACFARSSETFYRWLLDHRQLGPLLQPFLDGGGIPRRARVRAIVLLWVAISASALLFVPLPWVRFLMFVIAGAVTIYLLRLPVREESPGRQTPPVF